MTIETNGGARTIGVPTSGAGAAAHAPNQPAAPSERLVVMTGEGDLPERIVVLWNDTPVLYLRSKAE